MGINNFFNEFEFVECDFAVELRGLLDTYGSGFLGYL